MILTRRDMLQRLTGTIDLPEKATTATFEVPLSGLVDELDQMVVNFNTVVGAEHDLETGAHTAITAVSLDLTGGSQLTVGSAGAASALPATPSLYVSLFVDGVEYVIPAYAKS